MLNYLRNLSDTDKWVLGIACGMLILAILAYVFDEPSEIGPAQNSIDSGSPGGEPNEYTRLLSSLEKKVQGPRGGRQQMIIAVTRAAVKDLRLTHGVRIGELEFLRQMDQRLPAWELGPYNVQSALLCVEILEREGKIRR